MIVGSIIVVAILAWALKRVAVSRSAEPPVAAAVPQGEHPRDPQLDSVARVKPEELHDRLARNEVVVIDVRDVQSYLNGHIPGALHIPLSRIDGEIPYLPRNKPIVTYCT
jgi:predicted sulfurtransferase